MSDEYIRKTLSPFSDAKLQSARSGSAGIDIISRQQKIIKKLIRKETMASIFTKIINGEIPSYKIYEDDKTYAFLDIHPETKGHTLVVPKKEADKIYDLPTDDYIALMDTVKRLSIHMEKVFGRRTLWKVVGTDVPHAHVHLMPLDEEWEYGKTLELSPDEFEQIRSQLEYTTKENPNVV